MTGEPKDSALYIRISSDLIARLKAHAEANERSTAATIRLALQRFLEEEGK